MMPAARLQRCMVVAFLTVATFGWLPGPSLAAPSVRSMPIGSATLPPDLCSLITEQEAETILGRRLEPPQKQTNGDCWYLKEGGKDFGAVVLIISMLPVRMSSAQEFDRFMADQVNDLNESMKKVGAKGPPFEAERTRELNAPAYFVDPGLYVLKGGRVLVIAIEQQQALAIAAKALPRFNP